MHNRYHLPITRSLVHITEMSFHRPVPVRYCGSVVGGSPVVVVQRLVCAACRSHITIWSKVYVDSGCTSTSTGQKCTSVGSRHIVRSPIQSVAREGERPPAIRDSSESRPEICRRRIAARQNSEVQHGPVRKLLFDLTAIKLELCRSEIRAEDGRACCTRRG